MKKASLVVTKNTMTRKGLIDVKVTPQSTQCDPGEEFVRHSTQLRVTPPLLPDGQGLAKDMFLDLAVPTLTSKSMNQEVAATLGQRVHSLIIGLRHVSSNPVYVNHDSSRQNQVLNLGYGFLP